MDQSIVGLGRILVGDRAEQARVCGSKACEQHCCTRKIGAGAQQSGSAMRISLGRLGEALCRVGAEVTRSRPAGSISERVARPVDACATSA
jgi:hypothetical protein